MSNVRLANAADIPAIKQVADATELFPSDMLDEMILGYINKSKQDLWYAAVVANETVGFAFCAPERLTVGTWNLLAIGVLPEHQKKGVGSELIAEVEARLKQEGNRILLVETLGTPEFARTRAFYFRKGFSEEARIRDYYEPGGDKIIFWKRL